MIGRLHPLLVHLPIGMLLLAVLFEALSRTERYKRVQTAIPFVLLLGAVAAAFSCLTGWLLSQSGEYEAGLANRHQWLGIGVAIVSFSAYWLKIRSSHRAYTLLMGLLLPAILLTGHWGITLTHGEGYLIPSADASEALDEMATQDFQDVPDVDVPPPSAEAIATLRQQSVVALPIGKDQSLLSLNFVNVPEINSVILQTLQPLAKNIVWLNLSGTRLNDSVLVLVSSFQNLTRLHLGYTSTSDESLARLQKLEQLVYLNLVGTNVTAKGVESLGQLPHLQKLFLYQTGVQSEDLPNLKAKMPNIQIDIGGYVVPVLKTDTTLLPLNRPQ